MSCSCLLTPRLCDFVLEKARVGQGRAELTQDGKKDLGNYSKGNVRFGKGRM